MYDENPHIREMMLTGGSPTMQPDLVNELTHFAYSRGIFITIETEGSHFIKTDHQIGLISLSPKFSNSVPELGVGTPMSKLVDQKMIDQHNKFRLNKEAMRLMMEYHGDYHYKPVWDGTAECLAEIEEFRQELDVPKWKTWLMPAGDTRETLIEMYPKSIELCMKMGYNWTGRDHIISYDTKRAV
jgi:7-carboxy-7-deazaguanine synthase